eukprot:evm.model.NODE_33598_length_7020_cov_14.286040.1
MSSIPSLPLAPSFPNVNVASGLNAVAASGSTGDGGGGGGGGALEDMVAPSMDNLSLSSSGASINIAAMGEEGTSRAPTASGGSSGGGLNNSSCRSRSSSSSSRGSGSGGKMRHKRDFAMETPALVSPALDATSLGEWVRLDSDDEDENEEEEEEMGEGMLEDEDEEGQGEEDEDEEEEEGDDSGEEEEAGANDHPSGAGAGFVHPPPPRAVVQRRPRTSLRRTRNHSKPCQRSLHVAAVLEDKLIVFGGYQGAERVADCYMYDFLRRRWSVVVPAPGGHPPPSPRDRHVGVVYKRSFYVFGGFDGSQRVNDFMGFSLETREWRPVMCLTGSAPTPRHSHTGVVYKDRFYVLTG